VKKEMYLTWIAEEVKKLHLKNFDTYFRSAIVAAERHFMFMDI